MQTISAMWAVLTPAQYAHLNVASPVHTSLLCAAEVYATSSGQLSTEAALDRYLAEDGGLSISSCPNGAAILSHNCSALQALPSLRFSDAQ